MSTTTTTTSTTTTTTSTSTSSEQATTDGSKQPQQKQQQKPKQQQQQQQPKEQKERKPREPKEPKQPKDPKEPRQPREPREPKEQKENGAAAQQKDRRPRNNNNNNRNKNVTKDNNSVEGSEGNTTTTSNSGSNHHHHHGHNHSHNNNKKQLPKQQGPPPGLSAKLEKLTIDNTLHHVLKLNRFKQHETMCILCCDPIVFYARGECDHTEVCSLCILRQRELYKDNKCCICKTEMKQVIFSSTDDRKFASFDKKELSHNKALDIYFDNPDFEQSIASLWHFDCSLCEQSFETFKKLEIHLRGTHNKCYCEICIGDRKVFLPEQYLYEPKSIPLHLAEWNGGAGEVKKGKKGHPVCKFCDRYFYGDDQLYEHLTQNHFTCFLCEKVGVLYQYFKDYAKLRNHFHDEHYLCDHPECVQQKFIVFPDDIALKQHKISTHLDTSGMSKVQIRQATQININFTQRQNQPPTSSTSSSSSSNSNSRRDDDVRSTTTTNNSNNNDNINVYDIEKEFPSIASTSTTTTTNSNYPTASSVVANRFGIQLPKAFSPNFVKQEKQKALTQDEIDQKNKELVIKIKGLINDRQYATFKDISLDFKNGKTGVNEYYTQFIQVFGKPSAYEIFDELVALLPDQSKREELMQIHNFMKHVEEQYPSLETKPSSKKNKNKQEPVNIWANSSNHTMQQVKQKPTGEVYSNPYTLVAHSPAASQAKSSASSSSASNSMASKILQSRGSVSSNAGSRSRSSRADDSDEEEYPALLGAGVNNYYPSGMTSTTNFSKIAIEANKPPAPTLAPLKSLSKPKESDFPSLPLGPQKPKAAPKEQPKPAEPTNSANGVLGKKGKNKVVYKF